uniref:Uncharacterized protein n=1 Tax=Rhizophora mucronata TaxID=61149 RepID=A0A2P2QB67_RHIMU
MIKINCWQQSWLVTKHSLFQ